MSVQKTITIICDHCGNRLSEYAHYFLKISYERIPNSQLASFQIEPWEDLHFCGWSCIKDRIAKISFQEETK